MKLIFFGLVQLLLAHSASARIPAYLGVVNKADSTASFIDLNTGRTAFTIATGYLPHEIVATPDGRYAFISNYGKDHVRSKSHANRPGNSLTVVDLLTGLGLGEIDLGDPAPCAPHGMVVSRDALKLYVTCEASEEIAIIDIASRRVIQRLGTAQAQSHMMVISPDESRAYTANFSAGSISVLDLKGSLPPRHFSTGAGNEGVALSPDGRFIYASLVLENALLKIDAATYQTVARTVTDRSPVRVLASRDGKYLITANSAGRSVQVFDSASLSLLKTIPVGQQPIGIDLSRDGKVYVANMLDASVSEIDLTRMEIVREFATGRKPDGIAFIPTRD